MPSVPPFRKPTIVVSSPPPESASKPATRKTNKQKNEVHSKTGALVPPKDSFETKMGSHEMLVSIMPWVREFGDDLDREEIDLLKLWQEKGMDADLMAEHNLRRSGAAAYAVTREVRATTECVGCVLVGVQHTAALLPCTD